MPQPGWAPPCAASSYSEDAIDDLLGEDALSTDAADVPVHERRLRGDSSPLAIAARFFLLQLPVELVGCGRSARARTGSTRC